MRAPGAARLVFVSNPSNGLVRFSSDLVRVFIVYPFCNTLQLIIPPFLNPVLCTAVQWHGSQAGTKYVHLSYIQQLPSGKQTFE